MQAELLSEIKTDQDYFNAPGLSFSGMKTLAISPLAYWHRFIRPDREPEQPTAEMRFGSALHCAVLQPKLLHERYYTGLTLPDGALDTMDDLRTWLKDKGLSATAKNKAELIARVQAVDPNQPIVAVIEQAHEEANAGKTFLNLDDWARLEGCAKALRNTPALEPILAEGEAEVPLFAKDPTSKVLLKCKLDWRNPSVTVDFKTFSQQKGRSIKQCVYDAIWYELYAMQGWVYTHIRSLLGDHKPRYLLAFVQSEAPFELMLCELRPTYGEMCMLWDFAGRKARSLMDLYSHCKTEFGDQPWIMSQDIDVLIDDDFPQLAWSNSR